MKKRTLLAVAAGLSVLLLIVILSVVISRQRPSRHRVFRVAPAEERAKPPEGIPPVEQWSDTFEQLDPERLAELLERIRTARPAEYAKYSLGYLHARALIENDDADDARNALRPFLDEKSPFRELALYHQSEISDSSELRQELIDKYPSSMYREQAIEEEADALAARGDPAGLTQFITKVAPGIDTRLRRELAARRVELHMRRNEGPAAFTAGMALLNASNGDDAADRVARALDTPELVRQMNPQQRALLGETMQHHRHFDRAVALLATADTDELRFALGRSHFGAEQYAQARQVYERSATTTKDMRWKATFLFHASRAAQLQDDDKAAEALMTAAVAVPGRFPATTAALTQRIRTRAKQKRLAEAASDLALLRKLAPNDHALVEGSLALALAAGSAPVLNSIPRKLLDPFDVPEIDYWRARFLETSDPKTAFSLYLSVLRSKVPTHYAYFARERLAGGPLAARVPQELQVRDAQVRNLVAAKQFALAKQIETDRILLSSQDRAPALQQLAAIYREIPAYREIADLRPMSIPRFPLPDNADRETLLMAMGLFDEAVDEIRSKYPLKPLRSALTQAVALNRGSASRESIYAAEVLMKSVPSDYVPELLPQLLRQLLHPRYFLPYIDADSKRYGADPVLVLSIMREESRFNPRAKSQAAARGLLQFIITTARDIGRDVGLVDVDPEDLYDPVVIIRLGSKYVSELSKEFGGNHYRAAAAYNAGPKQVALWSRLAPAAGDDYFLASINFEETKDYVRKVMNSYKRYGETYASP